MALGQDGHARNAMRGELMNHRFDQRGIPRFHRTEQSTLRVRRVAEVRCAPELANHVSTYTDSMLVQTTNFL
jgi:hypothetical protein